MKTLYLLTCLLTLPAHLATAAAPGAVQIGERRELFVDHHLIEKLTDARLRLHEPRDEGVVLRFDRPWEGPFAGCVTVLHEGDRYRLYYRGKPTATADGADEVSCVAESKDGASWERVPVGLLGYKGGTDNNIVLTEAPFAHNFSPLIDANPAAAPGQRYKALGGMNQPGLAAFGSADGVKWAKLRAEPVITLAMVKAALPYVTYAFDSQNVAFWSAAEGRYLAYFRVAKDGVRRIARAESADFLTWNNIRLMGYRTPDNSPAPVEHHYTSQTHPYFRAPHLYVALAARFMPGRQVLGDAEAKVLGVNPAYFKDTSDAIFMTSRGGDVYDRAFLSSFVRPGIGPRNWVSRTNYPALNVVQTGPHEMSMYVTQDYAQATSHLRRYSLRLDGFASVRAGYGGGELLTKPLTFAGNRLLLNFATSAAGGIRVEVQDESGKPLPGFTLADSVELIGNETERPARWKGGEGVGALAGKPIRLRFVMKDADLYALRFAPAAGE